MSYEYYHPKDNYITDPAYAGMEGNYYHNGKRQEKKRGKKEEPKHEEDNAFSYDALFKEYVDFDKTGLTDEQIETKIRENQKVISFLIIFLSVVLVLACAALCYAVVVKTFVGCIIALFVTPFSFTLIIFIINLARVLYASKR